LLKVIIVVLLFSVVISLFSGLVFLFKDTGKKDSKRTLYALGVRITLAILLMLTIFYGLYTGELSLGTNAPWHHRDYDTLQDLPQEPPTTNTLPVD
jgi:hypothetical protein